MKTLLKPKLEAFTDLRNEIFALYPEKELCRAIASVVTEMRETQKVSEQDSLEALYSVLNKTETFNVMLTLLELERLVQKDDELQDSLSDYSYNQHRQISLHICTMYGAGATTLFGAVEFQFKSLFPFRETSSKGFLSKGISAIIASASSILLSGEISEDYTEQNLEMLNSRGVVLEDMVQLVLDLQKPYSPSLRYEDCEKHVLAVLRKEQTFHTIELSLKLDKGVENGDFGEQFTHIVGQDEGLYGVDESLAMSISNSYGLIAVTNFGFLDKSKPGVIGVLDSDHENGRCNTFIDDTVCGIVSAACARLAHNMIPESSKPVSL